MRRALLLAALVAALVVPAADAATIRRSVPAAGMSIALPTTWRTVDGRTAASNAARTLAKENPELAAILAQISTAHSVIKLFAFDPVGAKTFATNVNVVVSPLPSGVTIQQYLAAARSEIAALPGRVGRPVTWIQRVPAGRAVRTSVRVALVRRGTRIVSDISQWAFLRGNQSVVVSFTTTPAQRTRYLPLFVEAASSIRFA